jgi:pimeloyl-ACP methyl ester carboxylesterase
VLAPPSVGPEGGQPSGVSDQYAVDLAHRLAAAGYAAFRYDPPGVGKSSGQAGFQSLQARSDEVTAALRRVQEHSAIQTGHVGLWGISQGAWVVSMAAADHPDEVAFIITVSGAGVSVAEQQIYGIEAQSRAAGLKPDDIERAKLFGRLLIDWQLTHPLSRTANEQVAKKLGPGPWQDFLPLVYQRNTLSAADGLKKAINILTSIKDEPWAQALNLEHVVLPALRNIRPDQLDAVRAAAEQTLLVDPRDHLSTVTSPVLAFFGEDDIVQPTRRSAILYRQYLDRAGNHDVTIVILPDVGHDIVPSTPGYWERLVRWLDGR